MRAHLLLIVALALLPAACGDGSGTGAAPVVANRVVDYSPVNVFAASVEQWPQFHHPELALGEPGGTLHAASLGYDDTDPLAPPALGGSLTLGLGRAEDPADRACVEDGPGDDLAVYENPFPWSEAGYAGTYNELAVVAVAEAAGGPWYGFPHAIVACDHPVLPDCYEGFAGVVLVADGGDRFDLAALIAEAGLPADFRACYVKLTDGGTLFPDFGNTQTDQWNSGADIDALEALHPVAAPGLAP